jgi:hypothetical protein
MAITFTVDLHFTIVKDNENSINASITPFKTMDDLS